MQAKTLRILDACSTAILALWFGFVLSYPLGGYNGASVPSTFISVGILVLVLWLRCWPSLLVPALWAFLAMWLGFMLSYFFFGRSLDILLIDLCAWAAFGLPLLLSWLPRWLNEIADKDIIGPLKLWATAGIAALAICMASQFIATPKIAQLKAQISQESLPAKQKEATSLKLKKAERFSAQFFYIRTVLAAALMFGLLKLPTQKGAKIHRPANGNGTSAI